VRTSRRRCFCPRCTSLILLLSLLFPSVVSWRHVLIFRVYFTRLSTERDLRIALHQVLTEQSLSIPAISFLPVSDVAALDALTTAVPSSPTLLAAHVFALSKQLAGCEFNPFRINSDDEEDD
jgi:hypothetical protein